MRGAGAWSAVLVVLAATLVSLPADATVTPTVHTVTPAPGDVVTAGTTALTAWLRTTGSVTDARVTVDGRPVTPVRLGTRHDPYGLPVSADVDLDPGLHTITVAFTTSDGGTGQRAWEIAASDVEVTRVAGRDRFETAVALSARSHPLDGLADAAVLARGDDFADALAGAPLAAHLQAPLLLATRDVLPDATRAELRRVLHRGATVHVLGGSSAIGDPVAEELRGMGYAVTRHEGGSRFETAAAIASTLPPSDTAFIVSGSSYADALSASVPAARDATPILLTSRDALPSATIDALAAVGAASATIVGGSAVVSDAVERDLATYVEDVDRVAGDDRAHTAARVASTYFADASVAGIATGWGYADALAGAPVLASEGRPLLLTAPNALPPATADLVRAEPPGDVTVLGGEAAVGRDAVAGLRAATVDDRQAPHLLAGDPAPASSAGYLGSVAALADRSLRTDSTLYVTVGGWEVTGAVTADGARVVLTLDDTPARAPEVAHEVRVVATLRGTDGAISRPTWTASYRPPDPHFGDAGPVALHLPSRNVELIGFHQSNHDGARQVEPRTTSTTTLTMDSRGRGTGRRTAADIVADPALPVFSPATGTVLRAGTYRLYCDHVDHFLVIEPDAAPGWEVKVLHFEGLAVAKGDRVTAGVTRIGSAPRTLPFESQVDEHSGPEDWPHLHVEVVDPSIPDRPGGGC